MMAISHLVGEKTDTLRGKGHITLLKIISHVGRGYCVCAWLLQLFGLLNVWVFKNELICCEWIGPSFRFINIRSFIMNKKSLKFEKIVPLKYNSSIIHLGRHKICQTTHCTLSSSSWVTCSLNVEGMLVGQYDRSTMNNNTSRRQPIILFISKYPWIFSLPTHIVYGACHCQSWPVHKILGFHYLYYWEANQNIILITSAYLPIWSK